MSVGPYSQDILTRIINVQWLNQQWLLGTLPSYDGTRPPPPPFYFQYTWWDDNYSSRSADGETWGAITSAASGLGYTVFTSGFVAVGSREIEDPSSGETVRAPCFMHATIDGVINLGTVDDDTLNWQTVTTLDNAVVALSFAHDAFFISYVLSGELSTTTRLALTRDGETFFMDIDPFPGVPTITRNGRLNWGGGVVYNSESKTYATVGTGYVRTNNYAVNNSLVCGVSADGLTWTAGTASDAYSGIGAQEATSHHSSIATGKKIFVAAAASKHRYPQFPGFPNPATDYVLHACAVATSPDGSDWTVRPLPGARVLGSSDTAGAGDLRGDALAVAFIEGGTYGGTDGGYFVAAGFELATSTLHIKPTSKLWTSVDGLTWELIETETDVIYGALSSINIAAGKVVTV